MSVCPQCGTDNRAGTRFCKQCGTALPADEDSLATVLICRACREPLRPGARFCSHCGTPVTGSLSTGSICPQCGQPVKTGAVYCSKCGTPVTPAIGERTCPNCGAPVRANARFCQVCRTALVLSATMPAEHFCPHCGAAVEATATRCPTCQQWLVPSQPLESTPPPATPPLPSPPVGRFGTGGLLPLTILAGRYLILEKIAQGGMGAVYKAQDKRLQGKTVALKEMSESAITHPEERESVIACFRREAELLARLSHPHLVRVTDYFQETDRHYMVMEFIQGQTLHKLLSGRQEPFPEEQVLRWADQLCEVLSYLHGQDPPIIYRDMKPANVMITEATDEVKLIDFGIARFYKPGKRQDTIQFGTDGYAPPEQYGKAQTDARTDVYALGATLYQLLTLRDPMTTLFQFPPARSLNPRLSAAVESALKKAVTANREERYQTIGEFKAALQKSRAKAGASKAAPAAPPSPKAPPARVGTAASLLITPAQVDFGRVTAGGAAVAYPLKVVLPSGETAEFSTGASWLVAQPDTLQQSQGQVTLKLDPGQLRPGRWPLRRGLLRRWLDAHARLFVPAAQELQGQVTVRLKNGRQEQVPVRVLVQPPLAEVTLGWLLTLGCLVVEMALLLGGLGLLLMLIR